MAAKDTTLLVFDEKDNFESQDTQNRIGIRLWKKVLRFNNKEEFARIYNDLKDDEEFVVVGHVFHAKDVNNPPLRGFYKLQQLSLQEDYKIKPLLVSSGDSGQVQLSIYEAEKETWEVDIYSSIRDKINTYKITPHTKLNLAIARKDKTNEFDFHYGIITALFRDEFEPFLDDFEWTGQVNLHTKVYRTGHFKQLPDFKVVATNLTSTGLVDASVTATQMLERFKPKYLIMPGVCGGSVDINIGDIVLAKKVFMFQKGKISDVLDNEGKKIKVFNSEKTEIDPEKLYDSQGNQISIYVEKFEIEHSSMIDMSSGLIDRIEPELGNIKNTINKEIEAYDRKINIHFDPMACSTMVVNKEGYFERNVRSIDRKVVALEMESYGIARACQLANNGRTQFIIFKSVMDNMKDKSDKNKAFAGKMSAMFLKLLLSLKILD